METIFCSTSSFYIHRIPPQLFECLLEAAATKTEAVTHKKALMALLRDIAPFPLRILTFCRDRRRPSKGIKPMVLNDIVIDDYVIPACSDCAYTDARVTAVTLSRDISLIHLCMALFELAAVFRYLKFPHVTDR
ncbi:hypothetical protein KPC83_00850 [Collinsella sp. zg1085]|uniref:hypothetical protein n=1 Tax=Collinsella sp. zg1085 TaxID=2844380 RepID=UPI001C0AE3DC|nr:hypothetical protein [Collinsella sp. zg1085]QWT17746.1 hypothetical protein KPC83_00850 [Collinsella sp. zg1085]